MVQVNRAQGGVEMLFPPADPAWNDVSASLVRELAQCGGDIAPSVPPTVAQRLRENYAAAGS